MIHSRWLSEDTYKSRRSFEKRSMTTRTVVKGGPSWERLSITYIRWWTLGENVQWDVGIDPMTVRRGYDSPSSRSRSVIQ